MLHVILQVLAVIGIILLCILGLFLLLIAFVLFVPIRYRAKGSRKGEVMELTVKATYLLHMLTARYAYPEPGSVIVRLFGIKIFSSAKVDSVEKTSEEASQAESTGESKSAESCNQNTEETVHGQEETVHGQEEAVQEKAEEDNKVQSEVSETNQEDIREEKEKKSLAEKIQYTFHTICDKIKNSINKIKDIFQNISYYKEVLTKTENKRFYGRIKDRLVRILKSIRPRVIKADLLIGTGSPDTTAYIYGIYGMLMPILGKNVKNINIDLDFENAICEGEVFFKGRITLFTILVQAIRALLDKQLRVFLKQLKPQK